MQGFDVTAILLNPQLAGMLVDGFWVTLIIAIGSWILAMSLGILLLVIRLMPSRIAERSVRVYVSYHSNVPTLVQLMIWYFGIASLLPSGLQNWLSEHYAEATFAITCAEKSAAAGVATLEFKAALGRMYGFRCSFIKSMKDVDQLDGDSIKAAKLLMEAAAIEKLRASP